MNRVNPDSADTSRDNSSTRRTNGLNARGHVPALDQLHAALDLDAGSLQRLGQKALAGRLREGEHERIPGMHAGEGQARDDLSIPVEMDSVDT
jgi:hypothetical protein